MVTSGAATISSPVISAASTGISEPPPLNPSLPVPMPPVSLTWTSIPFIGAIPSGSSNVHVESNPIPSLDEWQPMSWDIPPPKRQANERRVSFGSVFPGSNGGGNGGSTSAPQTQVQSRSTTTFNIGIKPTDPPSFLWAC